jgi:hypothetical protein
VQITRHDSSRESQPEIYELMTLDEAEAIFSDIWPPRPNLRTIEEIAESCVVQLTQRKWEWDNRSSLSKYRRHANVAIALYLKCGSIKQAFKVAERVGLDESELRNAKQLTSIYIEFVEGGSATLEWWESLNSIQARLVNSVSSKHGPWTLRKENLLKGTPSDWIRIKELASRRRSL